MKNNFIEIKDKELDLLIKKAKNNIDVQRIFAELKQKKDIRFEEHVVLSAKKFESQDLNMTILVLGLDENNIKIIVTYAGPKVLASFSIIERINGVEIINSYSVVDSNIKHVGTHLYDEDFKESLKKMKEYKLPEEMNKEAIVKSNLPCLYGNWCGPGCSGPDAPINAVDACCKKHDNCYAANGYFNCECDKQLIQDLARYYYMGDTWAIIITEYFLLQYDVNCR